MPGTTPTGVQGMSTRARIYRALYDAEALCTRQMLAELCGISMPTLYHNLTDLMDAGLVRSSGEEQSTGGRRAQGLEIVPDARVAVGVSVTERHLLMTATDLRLRETAFRSLALDTAKQIREGGLIAPHIESFLDDYRVDRSRLLGVGITIPGMLTRDGRRIFMAPTIGVRDMPVSLLTRDIPCPVHVENDGSASGNAEYFVRRERRSLAYISLENGVGGAVVLSAGRPYAGANSRSGEFGHICVEPGGRRCSCGKRGCLEAYCSPRRIWDEFGVSAPAFFRGVEEHEPAYETLLYDILRHLAIAVNNVRMALDCDIVLGGSFSEHLQPYLPILRRYVVAGNPFDENADFVHFSRFRRHIALRGGALYFIQKFINGL